MYRQVASVMVSQIAPLRENMQSNAKIHVGYIIAILISIIVVLVTVKWTRIPTLANYLNFALGVTSLVLAVVAIIYAFFTNSSFHVTVSKIESAASSVQSETAKLERAVEGLNTQLTAIPDALRSVEGKVAATHELLQSSAQQPKAQSPQADGDKIKEFSWQVMDYFVGVSSWNGIKVLYLCLLACEKQKEFDLKDWAAGDSLTSFEYAYGYIVATSSSGFFDHLMTDTKVKVTMMISAFADRIRLEYPKRIEAAPVPTQQEWRNQIAHIESFIA